MDSRRRQTFAMIVSFVGHVITVGGFSGGLGFRCVPEIEAPEFDFEFTEVELLDPDMLQGDDPEPPPPAPEPPPPPAAEPPPPTPTDPASEEQKPPPEPEKPEEPPPEKKKFASKSSRADRLAPPTSTFYMLLVPKRFRRLPFRQQVLDIMAPLPDFELLIDKGRFDALKDFDHIVIASPDIRDWTQTFLAVDYRVSREEVKLAIERAIAANGEVIEWVEDDGLLRGNPRPADPEKEDADNRWFVFLEKKVALYVREEFLPNILEGPASDDRKTTGNFVANLSKLRRFAARQPKSGMQLVFKGIRSSIRREPKINGKPLPFKMPDGFEISASATKDPEAVIRIDLESVVEAKAFIRWWNDDLSEIIGSSLALRMNVGSIYDEATLSQERGVVTIRAELTQGQATLIMGLIADSSRKIAGKTPEEIEEMKQRRIEAMKARKGGKLPPSALDPTPDTKASDPAAPDPPKAPPPSTPPPSPPSSPTKPTKTPAEAGASENVPG